MTDFIAYYRISPDGPSLEAQQRAVQAYAPLLEIIEVGPTGPLLAQAVRLARVHRTKLIVATLDRLHPTIEADFVALDSPLATPATIKGLWVEPRPKVKGGDIRTIAVEGRIAARESRRVAAYVRAVVLRPRIQALQAQGLSLWAIAREFERLDYKTPRGGKWTATQVKRVMAR